MHSKLENFLEKIDPSKTIDVVEKNIYYGMATYHREKNTVNSREEYENCLCYMYCYLQYAYLPDVKIEKYVSQLMFGSAARLLREEFGFWDTSYEIMKNGTEGGVFGILNILGRIIIEKESRSCISNLVMNFIESLKPGEAGQFTDEYEKHYKGIIPINSRLWSRFDIALQEHPFTIKKLRELNA